MTLRVHRKAQNGSNAIWISTSGGRTKLEAGWREDFADEQNNFRTFTALVLRSLSFEITNPNPNPNPAETKNL